MEMFSKKEEVEKRPGATVESRGEDERSRLFSLFKPIRDVFFRCVRFFWPTERWERLGRASSSGSGR